MKEAPQLRRAPVTEYGASADRQHGRHPAALGGDPRVPDGVDATVQAMEATVPHALVDRGVPDSRFAELPY
jgi:hypothetical protein